ncbi:MFS multidrug transporter-like protein [Myxozyma melibiosi]|uniref:MFS multidrug transporter-like protein n=1 Tax=Myxozyma melibiosi TaxID=54550 RepID=A0ABR1F258_9ASCO
MEDEKNVIVSSTEQEGSAQDVGEQKPEANKELLEDQTNLLPFGQLISVFAAICLSLFVSYIDQSSLGNMLPTIGRDLNAETTISWAATATMIANTTFQVLYGRLSDIFGRKYIFLSAVLLLFVADLLCGFAKTAAQFYVFRGFSGIAAGGINALAMILVSDIVTLRQRGKYQGFIATTIGIANTVGPFIAAGLIDHANWRVLFYIVAPCALVSMVVSWFIVPLKFTPGDYKAKIRKVDGLGILLSSIAVIFILIPVNSGGVEWAWNSGFVISFFVIGGLAAVGFIYVEKKVARLPMMPLRLFHSKVRAAMFVQVFFTGAVYYVQINFLPVYFQNARGYSRMFSAVMLLAMVVPQAVMSTCAGLIMSRTGKYAMIVRTGSVLLVAATSIQLGIYNDTTASGVLAIPLVIQSLGIGCTFQPVLVALQANAPKADRAVIVSVRNLVRSLGAAVGLAIASALLSNVLLANVPEGIPAEMQAAMASSVFAVPDLSGSSAEQVRRVRHAYMVAHRAVFAFYVPMTVVSFVLSFFVKENGLERQEERSSGNEVKKEDV